MSSKKNIAIVRRLFDEVFSGGSIDVLDDLLLTNVEFIDPTATNFKRGLSQFKEHERLYATAFPDKSAKIDDIFSDGETVIVHWTVTGTHRGNLNGLSATGKNFKVSGISIYEFEKGKIAKVTQVWDKLGLLEQIGVISATAIH